MFSAYKEKVFDEYQKKRAESALSINLLHPTPGKLKTECLTIYKERHLQKDDYTLKLFFGSKDHSTGYSQSIRNFENDKFRPLINFLKGRTNVTEDKNIELLAWLIDFEPRPYKFGTTYEAESPAVRIDEFTDHSRNVEEEIPQNSGELTSDPETYPTIEQQSEVTVTAGTNKKIEGKEIEKIPLIKKLSSKPVFSLLAIALLISGIYLLIKQGNQECMYWTGDHYERISCNQKIEDRAIIALDTVRVAHLKRIMLPDTLTKNALGKVWYAKIEGELEFYTSDGEHPIHNDKRLRPITNYILEKYLLNKK